MVVTFRLVAIVFMISCGLQMQAAGVVNNKKFQTVKSSKSKQKININHSKKIAQKSKQNTKSKKSANSKNTNSKQSVKLSAGGDAKLNNVSKASAPIHLESVYIYSALTKSYLSKMAAVAIGANVIAARLPQFITYAQLEGDISFILGRKSRYLLKAFEIEILSRWVFFYTDAPQLIITNAGEIIENFALFEYAKKEKIWQDWQNINKTIKLRERSPSSAISLPRLIEIKLTAYESGLSADLIDSEKNITFGEYNFGPLEQSASCKKKSIDFNSMDIAGEIKSAAGVECQSLNYIEISEVEKIKNSVLAGMMSLRSSRVLSKNTRELLIAGLLPAHVKMVKDLGLYVSESGPAVCQSSTINENQLDVYFCTRSSRAFDGFTDTVIVIGKQISNKYHFAQVRLEGFQAANAKRIISRYLRAVGEHI